MTECVDDHSALVRKYNGLLPDNNQLVDSYNSLLTRNNELVDKYNVLLSDYDELLSKAPKVAKIHDALKDCLFYASTMDEVQTCLICQVIKLLWRAD